MTLWTLASMGDEYELQVSVHATEDEAYQALLTGCVQDEFADRSYIEALPENPTNDQISDAATQIALFSWIIQEHEGVPA
jgi:hypothetical protein